MKNLIKKLNVSVITFSSLLFLLLFSFSCNDDDDSMVEQELTLELNYATMIVNTELTLSPRFGNVQQPTKEYTWSVSDTNVIKVRKEEGTYKGIVTAIGEGLATVSIRSTDGSLEATCEIETTLIKETEAFLPDAVNAFTQSETTVTPEFNNVLMPVRDYTWTASPEGFLTITVDPDTFAATIQGIMPGDVTLSLQSNDGLVSASTNVNIEDENDGILKILAIGNSFSEDALETYMYGLATAAGHEIVIGNMYIGGAELSLHADNAQSDSDSYSYRKINLAGEKSTSSNVSLSTAIADENWDYISFQQASPKSGQYETFVEPLPILYDIVKGRNENTFTKYLLHKTWAYAENSTHSGFPNYNSNQMEMFTAINSAYDQAKDLIPTYDIVPAGTAIQNGRTSYLGDNFTRDGYHLNEIGKFSAACTWFEKLFGETVVGNSYLPNGFIEFDVEMAQHAAHNAVLAPNSVTELTDYQSAGGSGDLTAPVFINFSTSTNSEGWNVMSSFLEGSSIPNLKYTDDSFTGITSTITSRFNNASNSGEKETSTGFNMTADVSSTFFYGNAGNTWGGLDIATSSFKLEGFTTAKDYELCFFSSRGSTSQVRETKFIVVGSTTKEVIINSSSNTDGLACVSDIKPDANGEITITVTAGDGNVNSNKFFYLNGMRIGPQ